MSGYLLLLGGNQFQRERGLIGAEKAFDGPVLTTSTDASINTNKFPFRLLDCHETDPNETLRAVVEYEKKTGNRPIAVVPLNDFVLNSGYAVAQYFELPYHSRETIDSCRNKDLLKLKLAGANLKAEISHRFKTAPEGRTLAQKIGYPVVIKPLNFGGSGGVVKICREDEFEELFTKTQAHVRAYAGRYNASESDFVLERYIDCPTEISVEVLNTNAGRHLIGITHKFLGQEPYFSEIAHLVPSPLHQYESLCEKIKAIAFKACEALNINLGMAHVEMKIPSNTEGALQGDPIVIEVGCRTAGDGIMDLYEKAYEQNIYALHAKAFLGTIHESKIPRVFLNSAAITYLHPTPGVIRQVRDQKLSIQDFPNIEKIICRAKTGDTISEAQDWSTRYGFIEWFWPGEPLRHLDFKFMTDAKQVTDRVYEIAGNHDIA